METMLRSAVITIPGEVKIQYLPATSNAPASPDHCHTAGRVLSGRTAKRGV
jgi:hypothetical protein